MNYFVMEELENNVPRLTMKVVEKAQVIKIHDLNLMRSIDYVASNKLVSDRLKVLLELYLPKYVFTPVVYMEPQADKLVFWRFDPPIYEHAEVVYRNDGIVSRVELIDDNAPIIFSLRPLRGVNSIVVCMAVAESILRRGILGLKLTRLDLTPSSHF